MHESCPDVCGVVIDRLMKLGVLGDYVMGDEDHRPVLEELDRVLFVRKDAAVIVDDERIRSELEGFEWFQSLSPDKQDEYVHDVLVEAENHVQDWIVDELCELVDSYRSQQEDDE